MFRQLAVANQELFWGQLRLVPAEIGPDNFRENHIFFVPVIISSSDKHEQFETSNIIKEEEEDSEYYSKLKKDTSNSYPAINNKFANNQN